MLLLLLLLCDLSRLLLQGVEEVGGRGLVGVVPDLGEGDQLVGEAVGGAGLGVEADLRKKKNGGIVGLFRDFMFFFFGFFT